MQASALMGFTPGYIREKGPASSRTLFLFEKTIYTRPMNKEPFEHLIVDNVEIPLQRYPHIGNKIAMIWGTQECLNYMNQLLTNTDRDPRKESQGFDMETTEIILKLLRLHPNEEECKKHLVGTRFWNDTKPLEL
jgi:hypothetical protein